MSEFWIIAILGLLCVGLLCLFIRECSDRKTAWGSFSKAVEENHKLESEITMLHAEAKLAEANLSSLKGRYQQQIRDVEKYWKMIDNKNKEIEALHEDLTYYKNKVDGLKLEEQYARDLMLHSPRPN